MMTNSIASVLMGAVAMASAVATLFFVKFWRHTRDSFFLLFAAAFGIDAIGRLWLGIVQISNEAEPVVYLSRLVTFGLIVIAIVPKKNQDRNRDGKLHAAPVDRGKSLGTGAMATSPSYSAAA